MHCSLNSCPWRLWVPSLWITPKHTVLSATDPSSVASCSSPSPSLPRVNSSWGTTFIKFFLAQSQCWFFISYWSMPKLITWNWKSSSGSFALAIHISLTLPCTLPYHNWTIFFFFFPNCLATDWAQLSTFNSFVSHCSCECFSTLLNSSYLLLSSFFHKCTISYFV